ncbi:hypothetical protein [Chromatium okenii]|jgi:hypothetical protein|uniref:hypothetical protein n=1 Tax=Chromatium okenii TaxID=61644 RepID=UPI0026ECF793|nr:hypothetical protein [Chromatium okenii]MBV5310574.1 hypothetical protein [Chromatium okenii]
MKTLTEKSALKWFMALPLICSIDATQAVTIRYVATDIANTTLTEDLWNYTYFIDDFEFQKDQGFSIEFDLEKYTSLKNPLAISESDWDPIILQPDISASLNGLYDVLALVDTPSLTSSSFSVDFVWLGGGTSSPGEQEFSIYDGNFQTIASGATLPTIPVPGTATLIFLALIFGRRKMLTNF